MKDKGKEQGKGKKKKKTLPVLADWLSVEVFLQCLPRLFTTLLLLLIAACTDLKGQTEIKDQGLRFSLSICLALVICVHFLILQYI